MSMREIKFKYIFRNKATNKLRERVFNIEEIENYEMEIILLERNEEIVARSQWTGLYDKNNTPIYEGDIVYRNGGQIPMIVSIGGYWSEEDGNGNGVHIHTEDEKCVHSVSPFSGRDNSLEVKCYNSDLKL